MMRATVTAIKINSPLPKTRVHSGFGGIIAQEQERATAVFDASKLISELPESFEYSFPESNGRVDKEIKAKMLEQEKECLKYLDSINKQSRW